jgi:uncharacterized membrane protein YeaQ/YmgE (transglycosylase-associated protein family)
MGILLWILFGLIAGIIAKFILPGRIPGGILLTIVLGIVGAVVGGFIGSQLGFGDISGFDVRSMLLAVWQALTHVGLRRDARRGRVAYSSLGGIRFGTRATSTSP